MAHTIKVGDHIIGTRAGLQVEGTVTNIRPDVDDSVLIKAYFAGGSYRDEKGEYALLSLTPDQIVSVNGGSNGTAQKPRQQDPAQHADRSPQGSHTGRLTPHRGAGQIPGNDHR